MGLEVFILFVVKVVDALVSQAKAITTYRNKKILTAILMFVSQILYYTIVKRVLSSGDTSTIVIVSIASAVGTYLACIIGDKLKRDTKWQVVLTSNNRDDVTLLCNYLAEHKIKYVVNDGYTIDFEPTLNVFAFSKTKAESRLIDSFLANSNTKFLKEIMY